MDNRGTNRENYSKELKEEAVELLKTLQPKEVSNKLGVKYGTLLKWKQHSVKEGTQAFRGNGTRTDSEKEIYELKQKLKQAELERDI